MTYDSRQERLNFARDLIERSAAVVDPQMASSMRNMAREILRRALAMKPEPDGNTEVA